MYPKRTLFRICIRLFALLILLTGCTAVPAILTPTLPPTSAPTPTVIPTPTPVLPIILATMAPVAKEKGVQDAAKYNPNSFEPHHLVVLDTSGAPHELNTSIPDAWLPSSVSETELIVLVSPEQEVELNTQSYVGGPPITRYRFKVNVTVREAYTANMLWEETISGAEPGPFPQTAPAGQTRLDGEHIDTAFLASWLLDWLKCRVGPDCTILTEYTDDATSIAYSPDGQILAVGTGNKGVQLLNTSDWSLRYTLEGHTNSIRSVAFSPDGETIAATTGPGKTILLWNVSDGILLRTINAHTKYAGSVAFSPDGKILASAGDKALNLWSIPDGRLLRSLERSGGTGQVIAFSPDGSTLASAGYVNVLLWSNSGRTLVHSLNELGPSDAVFSPDGQTLAVCGNGAVWLFRVSDGTLLRTIGGYNFYTSIIFSPDGQTLATGTHYGTVLLWRVSDGSLLDVITGHTEDVSHLVFSPDGQILASQSYKTLLLWRVSDSGLSP